MENVFNFPMPEKFTAIKNKQGNYQVTYDQDFKDSDNDYKGQMILPNCKVEFDVLPDIDCNNRKTKYFELGIYEEVNDFKKEEAEFVYKGLLPFGIDIKYKNKQFRPINEVMIEIGAYLKKIRKILDKDQFEIQRQYILQLLSGVRYLAEFMS
jgi:hypothetical protein